MPVAAVFGFPLLTLAVETVFAPEWIDIIFLLHAHFLNYGVLKSSLRRDR